MSKSYYQKQYLSIMCYNERMNKITHKPQPGWALVSIAASEWGDIPTPQKTYDSVTSGEILEIHPSDQPEYGDLVGHVGHWAKFKDDIRFGTFSFVKLSDIAGISYGD
jgi:hypothetical protein